jgi:hypothetical protein
MTEDNLGSIESKGRRRVDGWMRGWSQSKMKETGGCKKGRRSCEGGW